MNSPLPIAASGYTLHVLTTAPRTHVARLVRPDGSVATTWTRVCRNWWLKRAVAQLCDSIESSLDTKATLPVYYATLVTEPVPTLQFS